MSTRHATPRTPDLDDHAPLRPRPGLASRTGDPIDSWLSLLTGMLRLPDARAREIRDELEDHMRTRVRDQLVEGVDESTAVRRAIEEVGEASAVAHRFRSAQRTPARRLLMNISLITVSAAALTLSVAAFTGAGGSQPTVYEQSPTVDAPGLRSVEITTDPDWSFEQFADVLGDAAGLPVYVHWRSLADVGVDGTDPDWTFDVDIQNASFETVMRLLNERLDWEDAVGVRVFEGRLEIASREYLDKQTTRLVRYDIEPTIERVTEWTGDWDDARDQIIELIQSHVHPDAWMDNGGNLASTHAVGNILFIEAPERFFPKIEWLLDQLADGEEPGAGASADGASDDLVRVYPLQDVAAADVPQLLADLLRRSYGAEWADYEDAVTLQVDERTNALLVRAPAGVQSRVEAYLALLDIRGVAGADAGEVIVRPGDSLRSLAEALMGDAGLWLELAAANGMDPEQPGRLEVGTVLRIPAHGR